LRHACIQISNTTTDSLLYVAQSSQFILALSREDRWHFTVVQAVVAPLDSRLAVAVTVAADEGAASRSENVRLVHQILETARGTDGKVAAFAELLKVDANGNPLLASKTFLVFCSDLKAMEQINFPPPSMILAISSS
jgi:D-alanine-D-alanine ligase-like ATP-grasp enzyme